MTKPSISALCALALLSSASIAQDASTTAPASTSTPEREVWEWKLQPPVGFKGRYKIWTRTKIVQKLTMPKDAKMPPTRIETTAQQTINTDYEVISRDDAGGTTSRLTFRDARSSSTQSLNGAPPRPVSAQVTKLMSQMANVLNGIEIDIKQGTDGRVWSVQGLPALKKRIKASLNRVHPSMSSLIGPVLDAVYNEKFFRRTWDTSALRPPSAISVGQSWPYALSAETGAGTRLPFDFSTTGTRRLISLSPEKAVVSDAATANLNQIITPPKPVKGAKASPLDVLSNIRVQGTGVITGQAVIDRATGLQTDVQSSQRWQATTHVEVTDKGKKHVIDTPQWFVVQMRQVLMPVP
jgi:hypothetical protein